MSIYREREIISLLTVLNVSIVKNERLIATNKIVRLFEETEHRLPHIRRLTLYTYDKNKGEYIRIVSTAPKEERVGEKAKEEDVAAIKKLQLTILYENDAQNKRRIDITYPIVNSKNEAIAAIGAAVSLQESDDLFKKAIEQIRFQLFEDLYISVFLAMLLAISLGFVMSRVVISPIVRLKKKIQHFSNSGFTGSFEVITAKDEIGDLAHAFDVMAKELNKLHTSMQEQIDEKTRTLERQFLEDELTKLPNREALFKVMNENENVYIAILDIASFKDINDSYGVAIGNVILQILAKRVEEFFEIKSMKYFRLGSDEIAILDTDGKAQEDFKLLIEEFIRSIEEEAIHLKEEHLDIDISIHSGISYCEENPLEKADIALRSAKEEKKDLVVFDKEKYDEKAIKDNLNMISKIKNAIENYLFVVYYQAIVDANGKVIKYESLIRMIDTPRVLSPYFFLEIAKKTKYYKYITKTVIFQAFKMFEHRDSSFSVNIEAEDIANEDTRKYIEEKLLQFPQPHRVVFEIVESEDISHISGLSEFIGFVKSCGAKIAVDDFGTGYSNFSYLIDLQPDYIKIDGSLVKNIDSDKKSYEVVETIVKFAHSLNIKVIAEFVHSEEVFKVCKELHVDEFQGYLFSEPMEYPIL